VIGGVPDFRDSAYAVRRGTTRKGCGPASQIPEFVVLIYEVRHSGGAWQVKFNDVVLFTFAERKEAIARLDDLAFVGSRLKQDVEIRIFDEQGQLVERHSALDYEI
jgi:hypothetical protein